MKVDFLVPAAAAPLCLLCPLTDDPGESADAREIILFLAGRQSWGGGELKARWASLSEIISF